MYQAEFFAHFRSEAGCSRPAMPYNKVVINKDKKFTRSGCMPCITDLKMIECFYELCRSTSLPRTALGEK